tara:strand:- start:324 stop:965 length:642 start_codon:yes stop_codon:yes gene_type:complete
MATFSRHQVSLGNVGSYQVAGWPYITGSVLTLTGSAIRAEAEIKIEFPRVTKNVTVICTSGHGGLADTADGDWVGGGSGGLRVHFHPTGTTANSAGDITSLTAGLATNNHLMDDDDEDARVTSAVINGGHYVLLDAPNESISFNVKCKEIYISRADCASNAGAEIATGTWTGTADATDMHFTVIAELTNIPAGELGSFVSGSGLTVPGVDTDP